MADEAKPEIWPPAPDTHKTLEHDPLTVCPHCQRKLLSLRSILCNWCGERIDDPNYQQKAAEERAALDDHLRQQVEREHSETAKLGIIGRLKRASKDTTRIRDPLFVPGDLEK